MFRKSWLVVLVAVVFVSAMSACGKKQTVDTGAQTEPVEEVEKAPPPKVEEEPVQDTGIEEGTTQKMPVLEDVFFAFDKSELTSTAKRKLEANARQLKDARDVSITIEGHCDERGTKAYNLALGERRAKAAESYLRSLGVPASRMSTVSYGEEKPFAMGHNEEAWAKNRRAHFVIEK